jgi:2'-5' RNA ligase
VSQRLFIALWPPSAAAARLAAVAEAMARGDGGRPMPAEKIHLTLAFLGEVPELRVAAALEAARAASFAPFMVRLDRLGGFRRAKVGWAGSSRPSAKLLALQAALDGQLRARDFGLEARPFAPHVTLVRKIERPVAAGTIVPAVAWRADALTLVRTLPGSGRYVALAEIRAAGIQG